MPEWIDRLQIIFNALWRISGVGKAWSRGAWTIKRQLLRYFEFFTVDQVKLTVFQQIVVLFHSFWFVCGLLDRFGDVSRIKTSFFLVVLFNFDLILGLYARQHYFCFCMYAIIFIVIFGWSYHYVKYFLRRIVMYGCWLSRIVILTWIILIVLRWF